MAEKKTEKNGAPMGPGTSSIKDPEVYEALRREGASEEKAARIANASARDGRDEVAERGGEAGSYEDWTKDELAKRARELDIEGRSTMTKDELIEALFNLIPSPAPTGDLFFSHRLVRPIFLAVGPRDREVEGGKVPKGLRV